MCASSSTDESGSSIYELGKRERVQHKRTVNRVIVRPDVIINCYSREIAHCVIFTRA